MEFLTDSTHQYQWQQVKQTVENCLWTAFKEKWHRSLNREGAIRGEGEYGGNKLQTYWIFKQQFEVEQYVKIPMPIKHRKALAKFRCGVAPIAIETGRYGTNRVPVHERTCLFCDNLIENEYHVLFQCSFYVEERKPLLNLLHTASPEFESLNAEEKLQTVFGNQNIDMIKELAKTLFTCLQKRKVFLLNV